MPAFPGALDDGILASDTNILIVTGLLQVSSWDESTPIWPVGPRGRAGDFQGAALPRQPLRTRLIPSSWASNSPETRTSPMRRNTQGQVGVPQILQHGNQTSLAPGMRTFDPGHQGRGLPQCNALAAPQQPRLLRLFPLLSCQRAHRTGPQYLSILPCPWMDQSTCCSRGQCCPYT